jgi:hypothetical protein
MKMFYSLKSRFVPVFFFFIIALCVAAFCIAMRQTRMAVSSVFAARGVAVTEKAVSTIDGGSFEAPGKSPDPEDPFYEETQIKRLALKNYSGCLYLYTMAPPNGVSRSSAAIGEMLAGNSGEPSKTISTGASVVRNI